MKSKHHIGIARLVLCTATAAALAACGHSAPSESDAKQAVVKSLGDCKYFSLQDFRKVNGLPGDTSNEYRIEVRYTVRMSPDSDVKDRVTQWSALYERYRSMKADAERKSTDFYKQKQAYVDANPNDIDAGRTFEQLHQDEYKPMLDEGVEVGNLASQVDFTNPSSFFQSRIRQACPDVSYLFIGNFFKGKWAELGDDVDVEFTQTLDMIKTDNGWQAAR
ncbi:hypothetical protein J6352_09625 [Burkholderia pseudomallei]|uniref:hypothetical protein n=1 Tax=Burkholderia pseudomallei TaxID=28450 RepID=UPI001AD637F4|nr:hypothetical protein [Burkholderia pseudomallei]MBO7771599.1 hypothetical protein [Burkholderia pseudomallei]MBO7905642.1 hypothetical protein [Burkholderia pseudomallei]